jgi:hypothetical protein
MIRVVRPPANVVPPYLATRKAPHAGLAGPPPRSRLHFTTTGSSWINQVGRWFEALTGPKYPLRTRKSAQAPRSRHPRLDRTRTRTPALQMGQDRRRDPGLTGKVPSTNFRRRILAHITRKPYRSIMEGVCRG